MGFPLPASLKKTGFYHSTALADITRQMKELAHELARDGFEEEAVTLRTTIGDLAWQYEGLIDKELTGRWPSGQRRPVRATPRLTRLRRARPRTR